MEAKPTRAQEPLRGASLPEISPEGSTEQSIKAVEVDLKLHGRVMDFLEGSRIPDFQNLDVEVKNGVVTIYGALPSQLDKQLLTESLKKMAGVKKWQFQPVRIQSVQKFEPKKPFFQELKLVAGDRRTLVIVGLVVLVLVVLMRPKREVVAKQFTVSAKVKFGEESPVGARVTLHPISRPQGDNETLPSGNVQANGVVSFITEDPNGLPPGKYAVVAQWERPIVKDGEVVGSTNGLPNLYGQLKTTNLTIEIKTGQLELPEIQFKR